MLQLCERPADKNLKDFVIIHLQGFKTETDCPKHKTLM
jgi:hypothetical protein